MKPKKQQQPMKPATPPKVGCIPYKSVDLTDQEFLMLLIQRYGDRK